MRKERKAFTVEVKRRPGQGGKKPAPLMERLPDAPQPHAADSLFKPPAPKAEPRADDASRRILPCLVTEAALDAAKEEALTDYPDAPRPRGRPRKQPVGEPLAPLAPRKRGRPRKAAAEPKEPAIAAERVKKTAVAPAAPAPVLAPAPAGQSARAVLRRAAVGDLPRSERWKRRLPKALR